MSTIYVLLFLFYELYYQKHYSADFNRVIDCWFQVFAKPLAEQEALIILYSCMFIVVAVAALLAMFIQVTSPSLEQELVYGFHGFI